MEDIISVIEKKNIYKENDIKNLKKFLSNPDDWRKDNA